MKKLLFAVPAEIVGLVLLHLVYVLGRHDQVAIGLCLVLSIFIAYGLSEIR